MRSKFAVAGHPIHPTLIALPIGLFIWSLAGDIIYLASDRDMMWYHIAFWTGIAAMVTALIAALPGLGDYITLASKTEAKEMATAHMVLNLAVVGLFFVAMLLMLDDGATSGMALGFVVACHAVGVMLLAIAGWLGGHMVYRYHLAVDPDDADLEREEHRRHDRRQLSPR